MILKGSSAKLGLAVAGLLTLAALTGCSKQEPGTPTQAPTTGSEQTSTAQNPSSASSSGAATGTAGVDKIDPCSLLPDADAAKQGVRTPGRATTGLNGTPECRWTASGQFIIGISPAKNRLVNFKGEDVTLSKHKALQVVDLKEYRGCAILMQVSDDVIVGAAVTPVDNSPGAQMCPRALEIAKVVDSKLP